MGRDGPDHLAGPFCRLTSDFGSSPVNSVMVTLTAPYCVGACSDIGRCRSSAFTRPNVTSIGPGMAVAPFGLAICPEGLKHDAADRCRAREALLAGGPGCLRLKPDVIASHSIENWQRTIAWPDRRLAISRNNRDEKCTQGIGNRCQMCRFDRKLIRCQFERWINRHRFDGARDHFEDDLLVTPSVTMSEIEAGRNEAATLVRAVGCRHTGCVGQYPGCAGGSVAHASRVSAVANRQVKRCSRKGKAGERDGIGGAQFAILCRRTRKGQQCPADSKPRQNPHGTPNQLSAQAFRRRYVAQSAWCVQAVASISAVAKFAPVSLVETSHRRAATASSLACGGTRAKAGDPRVSPSLSGP